jgi:hypothetical protein
MGLPVVMVFAAFLLASGGVRRLSREPGLGSSVDRHIRPRRGASSTAATGSGTHCGPTPPR